MRRELVHGMLGDLITSLNQDVGSCCPGFLTNDSANYVYILQLCVLAAGLVVSRLSPSGPLPCKTDDHNHLHTNRIRRIARYLARQRMMIHGRLLVVQLFVRCLPYYSFGNVRAVLYRWA